MSDTVHPGWDPTRLRQAREAAGLTQEDAAAELTALSETRGFIPTLRATAEMIRRHERGHVSTRAGGTAGPTRCATAPLRNSSVSAGFRPCRKTPPTE
ncbi:MULTISPECIES: hypothetical protein [unclassified Frankia]|uniref:hypothetical protein n=1 Tax=unclassified Frankia TaxID=2632575 RepID=UPI002AD4BA9D|nr:MULTISPECIES: hypothetical protein [unclassified Frankia]